MNCQLFPVSDLAQAYLSRMPAPKMNSKRHGSKLLCISGRGSQKMLIDQLPHGSTVRTSATDDHFYLFLNIEPRVFASLAPFLESLQIAVIASGRPNTLFFRSGNFSKVVDFWKTAGSVFGDWAKS